MCVATTTVGSLNINLVAGERGSQSREPGQQLQAWYPGIGHVRNLVPLNKNWTKRAISFSIELVVTHSNPYRLILGVPILDYQDTLASSRY